MIREGVPGGVREKDGGGALELRVEAVSRIWRALQNRTAF